MPRFILAETRALIIWALRCFTARQSWHNWPRRFLRKLGGRFQKINLNFVDSPAPLVSQEAPTLRRPLILYVTRIATSLSGKKQKLVRQKNKSGQKTARQNKPTAESYHSTNRQSDPALVASRSHDSSDPIRSRLFCCSARSTSDNADAKSLRDFDSKRRIRFSRFRSPGKNIRAN